MVELMYDNLSIKLPKIKVATGLYSNWDSFAPVDKKVLEWIENSKKTKPKGVMLDKREEVLYSLDRAVKEGGAENLISEKIYNWLNKRFARRRFVLGGNGNNTGRILFNFGLNPLVSYPCRPPRLMKASPNFRVACDDKFKLPREAIRKKDPEYDHIVFEFERGRHILSWDRMSSEGVFDYDFLKFACNSEFTDLLILSYAHLLLPKYKKMTDRVIEHLDNPRRPKVHLEFGHGSEESMRYAMKKFSDHSCSNSWGMNRRECKSYLGEYETEEEMVDIVVSAVQKYGLDRICIHTPKYVFIASKHDAEKEFHSLTSACLVGAASTFQKMSLERARSLPTVINPRKKKIGRYNFCLVPCPFNSKPEKTLGLGDAFTAIQAVNALS